MISERLITIIMLMRHITPMLSLKIYLKKHKNGSHFEKQNGRQS